MTRSRFFCNRSVIRQDIRQHGWIGIIYTLALLFALPLQMFLNSDPNAKPQTVPNLFFVGGEVQMLFAVTVPVAAALFLFRYLQAKQPSDLWHSLPLRREQLLVSHTLSGLVLLLVPVWLTAAVTAAVRPIGSNMFIYSTADAWKWGLTLSIMTLFLFIFGLFVGICTGQTILQGVVIYILLILPVALLQLFNEHFGMYLYGYSRWYGTRVHIEEWSPVLHMTYVKTNAFGAGDLWLYLGLSVLFFLLSVLLYRRRRSETAGQAIAFTYFNPLFKAGVMLCAMLISGTYFAQLKQLQTGWIIAGNLAGALIGYIAAEMILRKTWQILTRRVPLEFAVYTVLLGLVLYIPVSGLTGYENRVPAADRVTAVYAGSDYSVNDAAYWNNSSSLYVKEDPYTEDQDYIEAVRKLHLALATARPEIPSGYGYGNYRQFYLSYLLNNGRTLQRTYLVPLAGFEPELKSVMESEGYKRKTYRLSQLESDLVEGFRLDNYNKVLSISDPQEVTELKAILEREILKMPYEVQIGDQRSYASIQIISKPDQNGYQLYNSYFWEPSFTELAAWLEEKGYTSKIRTSPGDIKSAEIFLDDYSSRLPADELYDAERHLELARSEQRSAVITDNAALADILDRQRNYSAEDGAYLVKLVYREGRTDYVSLKEQELTQAIRAVLP